jgi:hypothetical protein
MSSPLDQQDPLTGYFTPTSRTRAAMDRLSEFLPLAWKENHCLALPILGPPGCGKTQFVKRYHSLFERKYDRKLRALYVEVSTRSFRTNVSVDFLMKLGDPNPRYGILPQRFHRLAKLMTGKYDIVFLDEFHRLIDSNTQQVEKDAADWVTFFLNAKICPLVIVGEMKCERVFVDSAQFEGRTWGTVEMRPFDWAYLPDRREYQGLLMAWEQLLELAQHSGLGELDCALRCYVFSRGLMRQTSHLLSTAAMIARSAGAPSIRREHLANAVDNLRVGFRAKQPNPFRMDEVKPVPPAPMTWGDGDTK